MFFGCLPCCGGGGGCPNHDNAGIVGPLVVGATVDLNLSGGWYRAGQQYAYYYMAPLTLTNAAGNSNFTFQFAYDVWFGLPPAAPTSLSTGTGTISSSANLFLPSRTVSYPYVEVTVRLSFSIPVPQYTAKFYEIPCKQNVSPQNNAAKTTMTFIANATPGGASSFASLMRILSASVHGGTLAAASPFPTIPANVPRVDSQPAILTFSVSGDRSANPIGAAQLSGAPGSLEWELGFETALSFQPSGQFNLTKQQFSATVNSITDATGASASVSAFSPQYSQIPAGPPLIP